MSGFEPVVAEAAAAELGTTALASEVMASNALAAANAAAYTPAVAGSLASVPAGLGALASAVPGMYGVGTATTGALSGGLPTLAEQLATTNPEILSQVQGALQPAMINQPAIAPEITSLQQTLANSSMPEVTNLGEVAGGNEELMRDIIQRSTQNLAPPVPEVAPTVPVENVLSSADRAQLLSNSGYAGETGNLAKEAMYGSGYGDTAGMVTPAKTGFAALMDKSKYLTKAKEFFDKQDNEDLALYGAGAGLGLAALNKKKKGVAEAAPYSGPLSRFRFDPDRYTAQQFTPPTPYQARYAQGGLSDLGGYSDGGRMLKGPGDGMSDNIPASIAGKQPARLANEEFVVPADVVSHLGNGSSEAGAKQLYKMMDRVRQARTGKKAQGKQIKADKYMPA